MQHEPREPAFYPELDNLLHPAQAFDRPRDVVADPDLTINEKRAVLAAWASDASAVEAMPALRKAPGGAVVTIDEILECLRELDHLARSRAASWARRQLRRTAIEKARDRNASGAG
jgi:hypothetical protein